MVCGVLWRFGIGRLSPYRYGPLHLEEDGYNYRKISNISRTKYQNLNVSRLYLQLSLRNILKPIIKWRMKM